MTTDNMEIAGDLHLRADNLRDVAEPDTYDGVSIRIAGYEIAAALREVAEAIRDSDITLEIDKVAEALQGMTAEVGSIASTR